jgi:hypothetical protein
MWVTHRAADGASATSAEGTPITGQDSVRERVVQAALMVVP